MPMSFASNFGNNQMSQTAYQQKPAAPAPAGGGGSPFTSPQTQAPGFTQNPGQQLAPGSLFNQGGQNRPMAAFQNYQNQMQPYIQNLQNQAGAGFTAQAAQRGLNGPAAASVYARGMGQFNANLAGQMAQTGLQEANQQAGMANQDNSLIAQMNNANQQAALGRQFGFNQQVNWPGQGMMNEIPAQVAGMTAGYNTMKSLNPYANVAGGFGGGGQGAQGGFGNTGVQSGMFANDNPTGNVNQAQQNILEALAQSPNGIPSAAYGQGVPGTSSGGSPFQIGS